MSSVIHSTKSKAYACTPKSEPRAKQTLVQVQVATYNQGFTYCLPHSNSQVAVRTISTKLGSSARPTEKGVEHPTGSSCCPAVHFFPPKVHLLGTRAFMQGFYGRTGGYAYWACQASNHSLAVTAVTL